MIERDTEGKEDCVTDTCPAALAEEVQRRSEDVGGGRECDAEERMKTTRKQAYPSISCHLN